MSKVDRTHRSFTSKTTRRVVKVASDTTDKARSGLLETEGPNPWDEQARPSGSDAAQSADFVVEVCDTLMTLTYVPPKANPYSYCSNTAQHHLDQLCTG